MLMLPQTLRETTRSSPNPFAAFRRCLPRIAPLCSAQACIGEGGGCPAQGVGMATPLKAPEGRPIPRYPPIEYRERLRPRGPPSWAIWTGAIAAVAYGFSQVGRANVEGRYWKNKKREQKMAIAPLLQAEEDLAWCEKYRAALEEEAAIMKHVPDWKVGESVYKTKVTWIPPIVWPYSTKK